MLNDTPLLGTTVGPWLLLDRLDSGSFGVVFRARRAGHPEAPPVALKMAKAPQDPRFPREAELLQRVRHPSTPRYEDQGLWTSPKGLKYPYVAMEWVEGFTLYDWFQAQPRSSRELLAVLAQVAGALADAHARGAVHRDVKGDNIRVTAAGRAVLVDWGSGWFAGAHSLTDTTAPPGTSAYRPPEQKAFMWRFRKDTAARWHSQPSDDLYALGVVLYRCMTGVYLPPCTDGG
ncbi:serine/threonine-protein kinase, partial [Hyalangium sp.]|uniref:serine/threonine-protein kinase n=1 Tax=Hyalangium sp. TaxID=2028555 RepID=UPI002D7126D3